MGSLKLKVFTLGDIFTNSYIVFDDKTKKGVLIDAPNPCSDIKEFINQKSIDILFILLTHAHFDHIAGLKCFSETFYLHKEDFPLLINPDLNGSSFFLFL